MNTMGISTDPALLDVELPSALTESPSVSTFMPDEEASVCPLLMSTNRTSTPMMFTHPLDNESNESTNLCNEDTKEETGSSTGSSTAMEASNNIFGKNSMYQQFQHNNGAILQDANGNTANGSLKLSDDAPCFVSWNWPLIRKATFYCFMSSLTAMFVLVIAMIIIMPKSCNPRKVWYQGSVFYEIFPASFQDSNNDGVGDLKGIISRVDYFASMGFSAVRLNSIYPSKHYPDDYENITSLTEIAEILGSHAELHLLSEALHANNVSLILDLPISKIFQGLGKNNQMTETDNPADFNASTQAQAETSEHLVSNVLRTWRQIGVDGFYLKGLEHFVSEEKIISNMASWKKIIGENCIFIISETCFRNFKLSKNAAALAHVDLVDVYLDVSTGTRNIEEAILKALKDDLSPINSDLWIHWNIGSINRDRLTRRIQHTNISLAATLMELMLPGTINVCYGSLQNAADLNYERNDTNQWPQLFTPHLDNSSLKVSNPKMIPINLRTADLVSEMIHLRDVSPSIYKNAICKPETKLLNTQIRRSHNDIILIERVYPRRNSFVSISNFGDRRVTMDMSSMFYSGIKMLNKNDKNQKVYFNEFEIGPFETIIIKLDK